MHDYKNCMPQFDEKSIIALKPLELYKEAKTENYQTKAYIHEKL